MNIGIEIQKSEVQAQPEWPEKKEVTQTDLSKYTLRKIDLFRDVAVEKVNSYKEEYGNGISSLISIYNASGKTLTFANQNNVHGHNSKYPPTHTILNGQWSVVLHVHSSGAAVGSQGALTYLIEDTDIEASFIFDSSYSGSNSASTLVFPKAQLLTKDMAINMMLKQRYEADGNIVSPMTVSYGGFNATVSVGVASSPLYVFTLSYADESRDAAVGTSNTDADVAQKENEECQH